MPGFVEDIKDKILTTGKFINVIKEYKPSLQTLKEEMIGEQANIQQ